LTFNRESTGYAPAEPNTTLKTLTFQGWARLNGRSRPKQLAKRSIHLVFANLKLWLLNIHHVVSHQHLHAYLNEFTFRFNRRFYPFNGFRSLLGIASAATAPTYDELYSGER
jgi:hypothetical protein